MAEITISGHLFYCKNNMAIMTPSGYAMAKSSKSPSPSQLEKNSQGKQKVNRHVKYVVPMPGRGSWHYQSIHYSSKKIHKFSRLNEDIALEDFQAQFLMEREYPID